MACSRHSPHSAGRLDLNERLSVEMNAPTQIAPGIYVIEMNARSSADKCNGNVKSSRWVESADHKLTTWRLVGVVGR